MNFKKKVSGSWIDVPHYIAGTDTETITTLPTTIYPLGQTATLGLKGNTVQNGTPTPTTPIMPQGTGERTGNLANPDNRISNANITATGVISSNNNTDMGFFEIENGKTYTVNSYVIGYFSSKPSLSSVSYDNVRYVGTVDEPYTFTAPITGYCAFRVGLNSRMIACEGSQLISYEPYGIKIPISSGGTTTPIYLSEVQSTRWIKKLVLTGDEEWVRTQNQQCYYLNASTGCPTDYLKQTITISICSHYQSQNNTASGSNEVEAGHFCFYTGGGFELYIGETTISSAADFKTYLAQQYANGTPVTIWYVLATKKTAVVNEPLMRIGNYADSISGISIPTTAGANTLDVQTTLKPSEVTVDYKGWHPVQSVHERENGAWI